MYTYKEQLEIISKIPIKEGEGFNMNCPFCGGYKTFGMAVKDGKKLYHCFKVSCGVKGAQDIGMSSNTIMRRLENKKSDKKTKKLLEVPSMLGAPKNYPAVMKYLTENNCIEAYEQDLIDIKYSPGENRVLFFSNDGCGAVGRTLVKSVPKWKQYGLIDGVIKVGSGKTAILVEDVPSACAIGGLTNCVGCALLGTVLTSLQRAQLMYFTNIIVALDADASRKAIALKSKLESRIATKVHFLDEDIKKLQKQKIRELCKRYETKSPYSSNKIL
jgi:hypothetical protein